MRRILALPLLLGIAASPAAADTPPPRISVTGTGSVFTPPDLAIVSYGLHGEGQTADAAVSTLVAQRKAVEGGIRSLTAAEPKGGEVSIRKVRARECDANNYGPPRLDVGACAVVGYVADLSLELRTTDVTKAATIVGLIGRLGASDPRVSDYRLADPRPAARRAMAAALTDAKTRAAAIAEGAGVKLGPILSANDGSGGERPEDIVVTGARVAEAPPPPPPPPPPIAIDVKPQPIETTARANVTYQILP